MSAASMLSRTNGKKTPWEAADASDKLVSEVEMPPDPSDPDVPVLPAQTPSGKTDVRPTPRQKLADKALVAEPEHPPEKIALAIAQLITDNTVRCWVEDRTFVAARVLKHAGKEFQKTYRITFGDVTVKTVELLR